MTTLTIVWEGMQIRRMSVSGHAGYAPRGRDIVCAGVSVLMTTCINALESVAGVSPEVAQDEKAAAIALSLPEELDEQEMHDAQVILKAALQGFEDISTEYPKHLKIIDGRKSSC